MPRMTRTRAEELLADAREQLAVARGLRDGADRFEQVAGAAWVASIMKRITALQGILASIVLPIKAPRDAYGFRLPDSQPEG